MVLDRGGRLSFTPLWEHVWALAVGGWVEGWDVMRSDGMGDGTRVLPVEPPGAVDRKFVYIQSRQSRDTARPLVLSQSMSLG
jgi:hypothetical protein